MCLVTYFLITLYTVSVYSDVILPICSYFGAGFSSDSYTYSASVLIFMLPFIKFVSSRTCSLCLFLPSLSTVCVLACLVWFSRIQGIFSICRFYFSVFLYCVFYMAGFLPFCTLFRFLLLLSMRKCWWRDTFSYWILRRIRKRALMARSTKRVYIYTAIYVERIIMTINLNLYWNKWNVKNLKSEK